MTLATGAQDLKMAMSAQMLVTASSQCAHVTMGSVETCARYHVGFHNY